MKTLGHLLHLFSFLWLVAFGLHTFAHLFPEAYRLPPFLRWFRKLPLPDDPMDWRACWPLLIGLIGAFIGVLLVKRARRMERMRKENSEA
jgi:ABC-type polysaccharide/polyol phosphate export permease